MQVRDVDARSSLSIVFDTFLSNEGPWKLVIPIEKNWGFVRQEITAMTRFPSFRVSDERFNRLEFDDEILLSDLTKDEALIIILEPTPKQGPVRDSPFEPVEVRDARNDFQALKRCTKIASSNARAADRALETALQSKKKTERQLDEMKVLLEDVETRFVKARDEYEVSLEASKGTGDHTKMRSMLFWNRTRLNARENVRELEERLRANWSAIAEADARRARETYVDVTNKLATAVATCRRLCNNILI
jgi:hypothetical protein